MLYVIVLILQLLLAGFIFFLCISFITGGPFVPSSGEAARAMIQIAGIKSGNVIADLGSGNGKLLFLAAQKGASAVGFEINPFLVVYTRIIKYFTPYRSQIQVLWKNFWTADLKNTDIVFLYLLPWNMNKLHLNFLRKLKPGTKIVTNSFLFPNLIPAKKDEKNHVYLYRL